MSRLACRLKAGAVSLGLLCAASSILDGRALAAGHRTSCATPEYREFDFWVGDWDVFETGSPTKVADARVDRILDGCVLHEDYRDADGHRGQSFTNYDAARRVWHQSWVTNRGESLEIEGNVERGDMVLGGKDRAAGTLLRGVWKPVNGAVRETAVTSSDGGKTWKPWFDIVFRRKPHEADPPRTVADDRGLIAALDTEYQAAVKTNDAATLDRVLSDDFVLVTGSGKIYTKPDLLAEARNGHVHYDHQEDTEQTVRVWANTAVVTALLTEIGTEDGKRFESKVWFSDTYVRTPSGWRYVFGQSSLPLPKSPP